MNEYIEVVENKRGKRRHKMTAKQAKYFGKRRHHRRHRNSALATLAGNPRHRSVRRYHHKGRRNRCHRNPGMFGGIRGLLPFDIRSVLEVGGGIAASKYGPQLVQKYIWAGMPTTGIAGYAVRLGTTIVLAQGVKMITKSSRSAENIMLGGVGSIIYDLFTEYAAPAMGLTGVEGYSNRVPITEVSTALNGDGLGHYNMPVATMSRLGNLPRSFLG